MNASGIKILEVRIRNFRSLRNVDVELDWLIVLIGANNSGKTNFLEAMNIAIGSVRHNINLDDIFIGPGEQTPPKDRNVIIDLLIRPTGDNGSVIDTFPLGSPWLELWGNGIAQDDDDNDFVGIRTIAKWNSTRGEYLTERKFLGEWMSESSNIESARILERSSNVLPRHLEPLLLYFMDAKRDILDEMRNRGSFWYKLVSDPGIPEEQVRRMERILNRLNQIIISNSKVLEHVQGHLSELFKTIQCEKEGVSITPLTRNIRDLSKGLDVNLCTSGEQSFSLAKQGMGTRSLASILTFKAYSSWRQKMARGSIHSILAMEEPEAHLHPQAQRAIFKQIQDVIGQRIISTHSPYLASQAHISQFRHFQNVGSETHISQFDVTPLDSEDIRKIDRMVMNTRGELLFARCIIMFEGETEEQALPIFAEKCIGYSPSSMGITFIGVMGNKGYTPFLRMASSLNIPWYIFSDGETRVINELNSCLKNIGLSLPHDNVFIIPDNHNYEEYIVCEQYKDAIIKAIVAINAPSEQLKQALLNEWNTKKNLHDELISELKRHKTQYASAVAKQIIELPEEIRIPQVVRSLLRKVMSDLQLSR